MEHRLLRLYRRLTPRWLLRHVPSDTKDRALRSVTFLAGCPPVGVLWRWGATLGARPRRALDLWDDIARRHAPAHRLPDLVRIGRRHAVLRLADDPGTPLPRRAALLARALEDVDGPHDLKTDARLIRALARHAADALRPTKPPAPGPAAPLRRIVLCLDILKVTGGYTHGRTVFQICRALLDCDAAVQVHLVISNEHRTAAAPGSPPEPVPGEARLHSLADAALPGLVGRRFFLHVQPGVGLSGLVDTCHRVIDLDPDLVLFGGGHRGPVSNESRVVRHCLFPRLPTAFFFFQANDQVDARCDLILARGPHRIEGRPGAVAICRQPYPTLPAGVEMGAFTARPGPPVIVSAIAGARMEARLTELGQRRLRRFLTLLDDRPGAVWHFIGATDPAGLIARNPALRARAARGQVVVHPVLPRAGFAERVGQARLFVHLPGFTGGSGGAGVARRAGVPILTFRDSDVAGRQPAETVFDASDLAGCIALARRLLDDDATARRIVERQQAHSARLRDTAAGAFLACLGRARDLGRARLSTQP